MAEFFSCLVRLLHVQCLYRLIRTYIYFIYFNWTWCFLQCKQLYCWFEKINLSFTFIFSLTFPREQLCFWTFMASVYVKNAFPQMSQSRNDSYFLNYQNWLDSYDNEVTEIPVQIKHKTILATLKVTLNVQWHCKFTLSVLKPWDSGKIGEVTLTGTSSISFNAQTYLSITFPFYSWTN